jgi:hypothetical protein
VSHCSKLGVRELLRGALLVVDEIRDFKIQRKIWLEVLRVAGLYWSTCNQRPRTLLYPSLSYI